MTSTRRQLLSCCAELLAVAATGLMAACQSQPEPITVTLPPAASRPTSLPTATGGASAVAIASPVIRPVAATSPSPAGGIVASTAKPVAQAATSVVGKPMYQMDPQHSGRSPHTGPRQLAVTRTFDTARPDLRPADALGPGPDIQSSTAIGPDGTIYATNFLGWLFALKDSPSQPDALDLAWRFRPPNGSPYHCTPALAPDGGMVYVSFTTGTGADARSTLFAVRAPGAGSGPDGQVVWQADLGQVVPVPGQNSPTLGPDGTLYAITVAGLLSAIDSGTGQVKWTVQTGTSQPAQFGQTVKTSPAVGPDGSVYTTALTGSLYAIAPPAGSGDQGSIKWAFDFAEHLGPMPLMAAPVTAPPNRGQDAIGSGASATIGPDGTIYVGANNSNFYAINPDGSQKWLYEAERELAGIWTTAALSADGLTLYFGANKGGMYALDTRDGSLQWQFNIVGSVYSSPALDAAGTLYTGSTVGHVFSLSAATGERYMDLDTGAPVWSAPSVRPDGSVVVGDRNGRITVLTG
jgi:outer membrane protein assembly factor BamB